MIRPPTFALLWMAWLFCVLSAPAIAADMHAELHQNRQQQQAIQRIQRHLQSKVGTLATQTQKLDQALLLASAALQKNRAELVKMDQMLRKFEDERAALQQHMDALQQDIAGEANAAWMHAGREVSWLDVLAGVPIEEIPHRKYMIELLMAAHEEKKTALTTAVIQMNRVTHQVVARRKSLAELRRKQQQQKAALKDKQRQKRNMLQSLHRKQRHGDQQLRQLQVRAKSLKHLLARLKAQALSSRANRLKHVSVRRLRGKLPWPISGHLVARFGSRQKIGGRLQGVRIAPTHHHTKVQAIAAGQVKFAGWFGGYGLMMVVDHGNGVMTIYAHNRALYHQTGDWVKAGDLLARVGSTGWVERPQLYFELRDHGKPVDPHLWCRR
ncbi:MAG: peptidoglycan DD-metalloendopeptidase family protein [Mariprofundales bacterium]|nr:peptidoglycan DD-metalloendopeptidase family protein [Mariprofundales bacterium]